MKKALLWFLILTTLALLIWGATRAWQREQAQTQALAQDEAARHMVRMQLLDSEVLTVKSESLPLEVPVSGTLRTSQFASVKAQYSGQIVGLDLREGDAVKAGQRLFSVAAQDAAARVQQAQQQVLAAQADMSVARRNASNNLALAEQGFISSTALANSEASLHAASAAHQAALAGVEVVRKSLADTQAASPIDGVVAARHVQPGEMVASGQAVLDIVDLSGFEVQAQIAAADSVHVAVGQHAQLHVEGSAAIAATVARISPAARSGSRSVAAVLQVEPESLGGVPAPRQTNAATESQHVARSGAPSAASPAPTFQLRDGLFALGQITIGQHDGVAVPQTAIRTDQPQAYLLLLEDEGQGQVVRQQPVHLGVRLQKEGQVWQAVSGLAEGSRILSGAVGILSDGTRVQVQSAVRSQIPTPH